MGQAQPLFLLIFAEILMMIAGSICLDMVKVFVSYHFNEKLIIVIQEHHSRNSKQCYENVNIMIKI